MLAVLLHGLVSAAPASAAMNGFEGGDGDQLAVCATATDWQCVPASGMLMARDANGAGDDAFVDGSKEDAPETWALSAASKASGKSDVRAVWTRVTDAGDRRTFLDVAFLRAENGGDTYLGLELNQSRSTWTNPKGASIPCRTDGDVLVSYEVANAPSIALYEWDGTGPAACPDGATGTWKRAVTPASAWEARLNLAGGILNFLSPDALGETFALGTFGEASLDLRGLADAVDHPAACAYFRQLTVKTRSSSSVSSSLQDWAAGTDAMARSCESPAPDGGSGGTDVKAPDVPALVAPSVQAQTCGPDVAFSGTAEPGSTVTLYDGALAQEFASVAVDGTWSVTVPGVADGGHSFSVEATDAAGNTSSRSAAVAVNVDATAPAAPTLTAALGVDGTVVLTGTAEAGSTVAIAEEGSNVASVTAGAAGAYAATLAAGPGKHTYTATASDACHTGSASAAVTVGSDPETDPLGTGSTPDGGTPTDGGTTTGGGTTPDPSLQPADASAGTTGTGALVTQNGAATGTALGHMFPVSVDMNGGAIPTTACAFKPFKAYVRMKGVREVRFMLNGRTVKVVRRADRLGQYIATINPYGLRGGTHVLTARVTFRKKTRKAKTVTLRFRRCDQCLSRRSFPIRVKNLRAGERAVSAVVYVNGKRARVIKGKRIRSRVVLTNLPKGTYVVRIVAKTNRGRTAVDVRRYRTCVPKR